MTKLFIEFSTNPSNPENFNAKIAIVNSHLGLRRPHCLNNKEVPSLPWDEKAGNCIQHPIASLEKAIMYVDTDAVYNDHTSTPIPYWPVGVFDGLNSYATKEEAKAAGYFPGEEI